jgi:hypothetical protein
MTAAHLKIDPGQAGECLQEKKANRQANIISKSHLLYLSRLSAIEGRIATKKAARATLCSSPSR